MKHAYRAFPLALLLLALAGCQSQPRHIGPSAMPTGGVTHIVIMWLNDPSDLDARDEIIATGKKLETIPGVVSVSAGRMLPSGRPVVDTSYDVAFAMTFNNVDDMKAYLENPLHKQLKTEVLDRYVKKYLVYDFVAE
ncbi:MAG TPA: Dabb family protein [Tepidisphaeraceae bacterium]|nr:Dabb family protein [Tepidisphaeraceae bacterium]